MSESDSNVLRLPVPPKGSLRVQIDLGVDATTLTFPVAWWGARSDRMARRAHNKYLADRVRAGTDEHKRW